MRLSPAELTMAVDERTTMVETEAAARRLPGPDVLATELATYEANRAELVREAEGSYVLIKGAEICGIYPTADEAYEAGIEKFGLTGFMMREIREHDIP